MLWKRVEGDRWEREGMDPNGSDIVGRIGPTDTERRRQSGTGWKWVPLRLWWCRVTHSRPHQIKFKDGFESAVSAVAWGDGVFEDYGDYGEEED